MQIRPLFGKLKVALKAVSSKEKIWISVYQRTINTWILIRICETFCSHVDENISELKRNTNTIEILSQRGWT